MSTDDIDEYGLDNYSNTSNFRSIIIVIIVLYAIFKVFSMILAGYLSWNCGYDNLNPIRIFKTSFSIIFSEFYLFYFFINSIILGQRC